MNKHGPQWVVTVPLDGRAAVFDFLTKGILQMIMHMRWLATMAVTLLLGTWHEAAAAEPQTTTITISDMDCPSCAKKITDQLAKVTGVEKAEADVKAKTIKVTPKAGVAPSPKELWETVEKLDKTPTRLDGPGGKFTTKPKA